MKTAVLVTLLLCLALWVPYFIVYIRRERRAGTPGSPGGSRGATPTLGRTSDSQKLDPAQTMRVGLVTDGCVIALTGLAKAR